MPLVGAQISISGMVQGVGYRYFCYQRAVNLGLAGWVRNEVDGTVSSFVEGKRNLIESLVEELGTGPPAAVVKAVGVDWLEPTGSFHSFEITRINHG